MASNLLVVPQAVATTGITTGGAVTTNAAGNVGSTANAGVTSPQLCFYVDQTPAFVGFAANNYFFVQWSQNQTANPTVNLSDFRPICPTSSWPLAQELVVSTGSTGTQLNVTSNPNTVPAYSSSGYVMVIHKTGVGTSPFFTTTYYVIQYTGLTTSAFTGCSATTLGASTGTPTSLSSGDIVVPYIVPENYSNNPGNVIGNGNSTVVQAAVYLFAGQAGNAYANVTATVSSSTGLFPSYSYIIPAQQVPALGTGTPGNFGINGCPSTPTSFLLTAANIATLQASLAASGAAGVGEVRYGNTMLILNVTQRPASFVTVSNTNTTAPTVNWNYLCPDGTPQQSFRIVIFPAAGPTTINDIPGTTSPLQPVVGSGTWGGGVQPVYDSGLLSTAAALSNGIVTLSGSGSTGGTGGGGLQPHHIVVGAGSTGGVATSYAYQIPANTLRNNVNYVAYVFTSDVGASGLFPIMVSGSSGAANSGIAFTCESEYLLIPGVSSPSTLNSFPAAFNRGTAEMGMFQVTGRLNVLDSNSSDGLGTGTWAPDLTTLNPLTGTAFSSGSGTGPFVFPLKGNNVGPIYFDPGGEALAGFQGGSTQTAYRTAAVPCAAGEQLTASTKIVNMLVASGAATAFLYLNFYSDAAGTVLIETVVPAGTAYQVPLPVATLSFGDIMNATMLFVQAMAPPGTLTVSLGVVITAALSSMTRTVTNIAGTGSVATYTIAAGHSYQAGQQVTISGLAHTAFNVTRAIASVTATTFTMSNVTTQASVADSGTAVSQTPAAQNAADSYQWAMFQHNISVNVINLIDDAAIQSNNVLDLPSIQPLSYYTGFTGFSAGTNALPTVVSTDGGISYPNGTDSFDLINSDLTNHIGVVTFYPIGLFSIENNPWLMACDARVTGLVASSFKLGSYGVAGGSVIASTTFAPTTAWQRFSASLSPGGTTVGNFGAVIATGNAATSEQRFTNFQLERVWTLNDLTFERFTGTNNVPLTTALGCYGSTSIAAPGQWWQLAAALPAGCTAASQATSPHAGTNSLKLATPSTGLGPVSVQQWFTVSGLTSVAFSWWWLYSAMTVSCVVEFFDSAGVPQGVVSNPGVVNPQAISVTATGTIGAYAQATPALVSVPPSAAYASITFTAAGNALGTAGTCFIDDIVYTPVGTLAASTPFLDGGWSAGGLGTGSDTVLQRSTDDKTWATVRVAPGTAAPTAIVGPDYTSVYTDYEYPILPPGNTETLFYQAFVVAPNGFFSPLNSFTLSDANGFAPSNWLLIDPLHPADNVILQVVTKVDFKTDENQTVLMPAGRGKKVVLGDSLIMGDTITLPLQTLTNADFLALQKQYSKTYPLVLCSPDGEKWTVRATTRSRTRTWQGSYSRPFRTYSLVFETVDSIA